MDDAKGQQEEGNQQRFSRFLKDVFGMRNKLFPHGGDHVASSLQGRKKLGHFLCVAKSAKLNTKKSTRRRKKLEMHIILKAHLPFAFTQDFKAPLSPPNI